MVKMKQINMLKCPECNDEIEWHVVRPGYFSCQKCGTRLRASSNYWIRWKVIGAAVSFIFCWILWRIIDFNWLLFVFLWPLLWMICSSLITGFALRSNPPQIEKYFPGGSLDLWRR